MARVYRERTASLAWAAELYRGQRGLKVALQILRPRICPFDAMIRALPEGSDVLDVGCGAGLFLGLAARSGKLRYGVGFDSDARALAIAQSLVLPSDSGARLVFRHLQVEDRWPEGAFDVVSMIDVMHHVPVSVRPKIFIAAAAALKEGGLFLYKDISAADRPRAFMNRVHDLVLARQWVTYSSAGDIRQMALAQGLAERSYEKIDLYWYGHDLHVFKKRTL